MPDAGFTIEVIGREELKQALGQAGERVKEGMRRGLKAACIAIETTARKNAPRFESGLVNSITHEVGPWEAGGIEGRVGTNRKVSWKGKTWSLGRIIEMGSRPHLAPIGLTEYGQRWLRHHGFAKWRGKSVKFGASKWIVPVYIPVSGKARPFLLPALEANKDRVRELVASELRKALATP